MGNRNSEYPFASVLILTFCGILFTAWVLHFMAFEILPNHNSTLESLGVNLIEITIMLVGAIIGALIAAEFHHSNTWSFELYPSFMKAIVVTSCISFAISMVELRHGNYISMVIMILLGLAAFYKPFRNIWDDNRAYDDTGLKISDPPPLK